MLQNTDRLVIFHGFR